MPSLKLIGSNPLFLGFASLLGECQCTFFESEAKLTAKLVIALLSVPAGSYCQVPRTVVGAMVLKIACGTVLK